MFVCRYRFFDDEVLDGRNMVSLHPLQNGCISSQQNGNNGALLSTPTAPRTPESPNRFVLKMLLTFQISLYSCKIVNEGMGPQTKVSLISSK
jgi:hypothetical protein